MHWYEEVWKELRTTWNPLEICGMEIKLFLFIFILEIRCLAHRCWSSHSWGCKHHNWIIINMMIIMMPSQLVFLQLHNTLRQDTSPSQVSTVVKPSDCLVHRSWIFLVLILLSRRITMMTVMLMMLLRFIDDYMAQRSWNVFVTLLMVIRMMMMMWFWWWWCCETIWLPGPP